LPLTVLLFAVCCLLFTVLVEPDAALAAHLISVFHEETQKTKWKADEDQQRENYPTAGA
jgi:hypothetical protein